MKRKSIINLYIYIILLLLIYEASGNVDCSKITMSNDGGQECLETCKQGVNSNECIQWRCNNFKEMLQGFNFIDSQLEYSKNIIINSQNCIAENISFVEYNERDIIEM